VIAVAQYLSRSNAPPLLGQVVVAFGAGFLAVLVFHQGMLGLLHAIGFTPGVPYPMKPTAPLGIPQIWSLAFWGGVWGIIFFIFFALVKPTRPSGLTYFISALLFGAIAPTLVAWFVVSPIKGVPSAGGWQGAAMATALMINAAWGIGTAIFLSAAAKWSRIWNIT
jgi:hypothetical protein